MIEEKVGDFEKKDLDFLIIYGDMAGTGPVYLPSVIGTVGIVGGNAKATDLRPNLVDFTSINAACFDRRCFFTAGEAYTPRYCEFSTILVI